jgi:hypothetical protein
MDRVNISSKRKRSKGQKHVDLYSKIVKSNSKVTENFRLSIQSFSNTIIEFSLKYLNHYKLFWRREHTEDNDEISIVIENIYTKLTTIQREQAKKKQVDVESQAIGLWSLIHGYVLLRLDENLKVGYDEVTGINRQIALLMFLLMG